MDLINAITDDELGEAKEILNKHGGDLDINSKDLAGNNVLHVLMNCSSLDTERKGLIDKIIEAGVDIDCENTKGQTPLHLATVRGNREAVKMLVELGASLRKQCRTDDNNTVLNVM